MKAQTDLKKTENIVLTAILSGSINLVISLTYIVLSILGIIYRTQCEPYDPENLDGDQYFLNILYRVYIQSGSCDQRLQVNGLTHPDTVFLLLVFTLVVSIFVCVSSSLLIAVSASNNEDTKVYKNIVSYIHVAACLTSLVVDIAFATHFGIDYNNITKEMRISLPGLAMNYQNDMVRLSAILLMAISLKGFIGHAINIVLLILLVIFIVKCQKKIEKEEHSIHKLGVLSAYNEKHRRQEDSWSRQSDMFLQLPRSQQCNPAFTNDDDYTAMQTSRSPILREGAMSEYNSRFYDRPETWQQRATPVPATSSSRPFSYLEEIKRPATSLMKTPPPPPPVPAPDYSPLSVRRLKSALKPTYM